MPLPPGVYEQLVTESLAQLLRALPADFVELEDLDEADAHRILSKHVASVVAQVLKRLPEDNRLPKQIAIANALLETLRTRAVETTLASGADIDSRAQQLRGVRPTSPLGGAGPAWIRPSTPLSVNALLVNAAHEPNVGAELAREIESADSICLLCAFVKWHGVRILLEPLRRFRARGGRLQVLTTTYMGVTETRALNELITLGAELRVTYETEATRLHAKAWLFTRKSGLNTAYIGSSNLSKSALVDGLEWNVRVSSEESPAVLNRFRSAFETYWEAFDPYDEKQFERALQRQQTDPLGENFAALDLEPHEHQKQMLYDLEVARDEHGHHRNLVVAATGTGKTLVTAFDFRRLRLRYPNPRLLFVAHTKEILLQSVQRFRAVLRDPGFGELFVDGRRPVEWNHVFASIQSLHAAKDLPAPDHFDVVIIDEFHHAEAKTYQDLLAHLKPKELLGLTATPERTNGTNVADLFFDGRTAVELRLWEALEDNLLAPFQYFGIGYGVDLAQLRFSRGRGYDVGELENVYTADDARVLAVIDAARRQLPDIHTMRAIGFCVSVRHAKFMADRFNKAGLPSMAVSGDSSREERREALAHLQNGSLRAVFTVDLFNEGVDIPDADTLFFLRPTESATLFLQQLGRGLRKRQGKVLTVLDFIGRQHSEFRFDLRFRALTGGSRRDVQRGVEGGFTFLPPGCHVELDKVAREHVLENVRRALTLRWDGLADELRRLGPVGLPKFLNETGLELGEFYSGSSGHRGFAGLRRHAGVDSTPVGPQEPAVARAVARFLHLNDVKQLELYLQTLRQAAAPLGPHGARTERQLAMLSAVLWDKQKFASLHAALVELWKHPAIIKELIEVFEVLRGHVDHRAIELGILQPVPLHVHCRYSLVEIMAAFGEHRPDRPFRTQAGIHHVKSANTDLLFVTLKKSEKEYSPTTLYRDFALSPTLFHWESQASDEEGGEAPQRYIHHAQRGTAPLLFVRDRKKDSRGETAAYVLLGPVDYVRHEGSRPIAFTWRLRHEMPPDVFSAARSVS